ncbi:MAG TPA: CoA-binding protein [Actinomycetota bacterium]|nr:CoA-binding protein [Actinomycetota bacterium]
MADEPGVEQLRSILDASRTIAVVGLSSNPERYSFEVASYMQDHGYRVIPVNPNETEVLGERAYPSLLQVPDHVDVVNVFRRPEEAPEIARQAVSVGATALWLQTGIVSEEARRIAEEGGLVVVMDKCIMVTDRRLRRTDDKEA